MKPVAVLGGGPAGAFAAERLAATGIPVLLFDDHLAWEKPCGGGFTYKACVRYGFLLENEYPKRLIHTTVLSAEGAGEARLRFRDPLVIYSRLDLNRMLLERAERAGAQLEKARVLEISRCGQGWRVRTSSGVVEAGQCIVATGARNGLRGFGTAFAPDDTLRTLGYYVEGTQEHVEVHFPAGLEGYIWLFPRCGHISAGIGAKGVPAAELRRRLEQFLTERSIRWKGAPFYSHLLPALASSSWARNRVAGEGWLAVGDAAGMVDPITGEGLYYALLSAECAAEALIKNSDDPGPEYRRAIQAGFCADLAYASSISHRFFTGTFVCGSVTARMVQLARRSPAIARVVEDLFAGAQPYRTLKARLKSTIGDAVIDTMLFPLRGREMARESDT